MLVLEEVAGLDDRQRVEEKIHQIETLQLSARAWKGRGMKNAMLDRQGKMGTVINLKLGHTTIDMSLRSLPTQTQAHGFVHVRLGGVLLGSIYVDHETWEHSVLSFNSSGGRRWLNLELVNGFDDPKKGGPIVELGELKIIHPA